jgi:thiamine biosynthesis lipoprotein
VASHRFDAIGTSWHIRTAEPLPSTTIGRLHARAEQFDTTYSRFRPDSLVSQLAERPGSYRFPADAPPLFDLYRTLYRATDGTVSPLVGRALEHLGYDADYSLRRRAGTTTVPDWDDVLHIDGALVTATQSVMLDVGAAGKGYLVDLLAEILLQQGFSSYLIDGSGDLLQWGGEVCRVGLENPLDPTQVIGFADLENAALCASATNRRQWGPGLHHIIDPATGAPVSGVLATWVVAGSAMLADGLATSLFLSQPDVLARDFDFSYVRMFSSGAVDWSANFPGEVFG